MTLDLVYTFEVEQEDGVYVAQGIEYPSAITQAGTKEELQRMMKEALECVIMCDLSDGGRDNVTYPTETLYKSKEFTSFVNVNLDEIEQWMEENPPV